MDIPTWGTRDSLIVLVVFSRSIAYVERSSFPVPRSYYDDPLSAEALKVELHVEHLETSFSATFRTFFLVWIRL